jgi:hypothetical protein
LVGGIAGVYWLGNRCLAGPGARWLAAIPVTGSLSSTSDTDGWAGGDWRRGRGGGGGWSLGRAGGGGCGASRTAGDALRIPLVGNFAGVATNAGSSSIPSLTTAYMMLEHFYE